MKEGQEWFAGSLASYGFGVDKWAEDLEKIRPNVVGMMKGEGNGSGNGRSLIFNGHKDAVPVSEQEKWVSDPFRPVMEGFKKELPFIDLFYRLEEQRNMRWRDRVLGSRGYPYSDKQESRLLCKSYINSRWDISGVIAWVCEDYILGMAS